MLPDNTVYATITYPLRDDRVLLIYKKRGFGAGKYNGAGGKIEEGEDKYQAAAREVWEEIGVVVQELVYRGVLVFYSTLDRLDIVVHVFVTTKFSGNPKETAEAKPAWFRVDRLPWDKMWEDDRIWLKPVLQGKNVFGVFRFDEGYRQLLDWSLEVFD